MHDNRWEAEKEEDWEKEKDEEKEKEDKPKKEEKTQKEEPKTKAPSSQKVCRLPPPYTGVCVLAHVCLFSF